MNEKTLYVIAALEKIYTYYEMERDTYRARAFKRVVGEIRQKKIDLTKVDPFHIEGVGPSIAEEIEQILRTGSSERLRAIEEELVDFSDLQRLPGIGPVKAKEIYKAYQVTTIKELKDFLDRGVVVDYELKEKVAKVDATVEYISYEQAIGAGKKMIASLQPFVMNDLISVAGSLRRKVSKVRDIDILLVPKDETVDLYGILKQLGYKVEYGGEQKIRIEYIIEGIPKGGDIVITTKEEWACAINYLTGSKEFNIGIRARLKKMGYTINEHRLMQIETGNVVPLSREEDLFEFLGIRFVKPEERKAFSDAWRRY